MYDACTLDAKVNSAAFDGANDFGDLVRPYNGTALRIRHQTTRAKDPAQSTDFRHHAANSYGFVELDPTFLLDLLYKIHPTDEVRTGSLSRPCRITLSKHHHSYGFTRTKWQRHRTAHHLICLTRIHTQPEGRLYRFIELCSSGISENL
jgi:hypothetical protein